MSTPLVVSVTDELVAELERTAKNTCSYGKDDWFIAKDLRSEFEEDDAKYIGIASPYTILALLAERAELKRDAARYWKLRYGIGWPAVFADSENQEPLRMALLDAAIDAAMQSKVKP